MSMDLANQEIDELLNVLHETADQKLGIEEEERRADSSADASTSGRPSSFRACLLPPTPSASFVAAALSEPEGTLVAVSQWTRLTLYSTGGAFASKTNAYLDLDLRAYPHTSPLHLLASSPPSPSHHWGLTLTQPLATSLGPGMRAKGSLVVHLAGAAAPQPQPQAPFNMHAAGAAGTAGGAGGAVSDRAVLAFTDFPPIVLLGNGVGQRPLHLLCTALVQWGEGDRGGSPQPQGAGPGPGPGPYGQGPGSPQSPPPALMVFAGGKGGEVAVWGPVPALREEAAALGPTFVPCAYLQAPTHPSASPDLLTLRHVTLPKPSRPLLLALTASGHLAAWALPSGPPLPPPPQYRGGGYYGGCEFLGWWDPPGATGGAALGYPRDIYPMGRVGAAYGMGGRSTAKIDLLALMGSQGGGGDKEGPGGAVALLRLDTTPLGLAGQGRGRALELVTSVSPYKGSKAEHQDAATPERLACVGTAAGGRGGFIAAAAAGASGGSGGASLDLWRLSDGVRVGRLPLLSSGGEDGSRPGHRKGCFGLQLVSPSPDLAIVLYSTAVEAGPTEEEKEAEPWGGDEPRGQSGSGQKGVALSPSVHSVLMVLGKGDLGVGPNF